MSGESNFEFKIKINGVSWDYEKGEYYDNGFIKTYYAKDFNSLRDTIVDFVNGENRFIEVLFNPETRKFDFIKLIANEENIERALEDAFLNNALTNISHKVYFALDSSGALLYWDKLCDTPPFDNAGGEYMAEYFVTVRLVVKKEERML